MTFDDLFRVVESLRHSQGFYSRLFENLLDITEEEQEEITKVMQEANLKTDLDIILWLEG